MSPPGCYRCEARASPPDASPAFTARASPPDASSVFPALAPARRLTGLSRPRFPADASPLLPPAAPADQGTGALRGATARQGATVSSAPVAART
ncbi:hypothetical protein GCM10027028_18870 [Streptomyces sundarbansensis]